MRRVGIADGVPLGGGPTRPRRANPTPISWPRWRPKGGRRFHPPKGDFFRLGQVCREFEARFGLRQTAPREPATPKRPTSQETRKAQRKHWGQPTRVLLREKVRAVAGTAESVEDFLRRLRDEGVLVTERLSARDGSVTGYAVAQQRPSKDGTVEQVWFSGGKLAADLTIPKLRLRWPESPAGSARAAPAPQVDRDEVWRQAVQAAREATSRVRAHAGDPTGASRAAWEARDFLASLSRLVPGRDGRALRDAAAGFERAGHAALGGHESPVRAGVGCGRRRGC